MTVDSLTKDHILEYIEKNPGSSVTQIRNHLSTIYGDFNRNTLYNRLKWLVENGFVKSVPDLNEMRSPKWYLVDKDWRNKWTG